MPPHYLYSKTIVPLSKSNTRKRGLFFAHHSYTPLSSYTHDIIITTSLQRAKELKLMAQSMFMSSTLGGNQVFESKREPLLQSQIRRLRPTPFSLTVLSSPSRRGFPSSSPSPSYLPTLALFKSKAKAVPKKVCLLNIKLYNYRYIQTILLALTSPEF